MVPVMEKKKKRKQHLNLMYFINDKLRKVMQVLKQILYSTLLIICSIFVGYCVRFT